MLVPSARFLVPLRDLHPRDVAQLTDAGLTPYRTIKLSLPLLVPGPWAVVIGVGDLGVMGIQMLAALSFAGIIAVDSLPQKLEVAEEVGASEAILAGGNAAAPIQELTRGQRAELVLDLVGADSTLALAAVVGRKLGHLTLVGLAGGSIPSNFFAVPYECSVATHFLANQAHRVTGVSRNPRRPLPGMDENGISVIYRSFIQPRQPIVDRALYAGDLRLLF